MAVSLIITTVQQIRAAIGVGLVSEAAAAVILFIGDSLTAGIVSYRYALLVSEGLVKFHYRLIQDTDTYDLLRSLPYFYLKNTFLY